MNNCETACWSSSSTSGVGIVHKKVINSGSAAGYSLLQQGAIKPLQVVLYIHSFMSGCAHRFERYYTTPIAYITSVRPPASLVTSCQHERAVCVYVDEDVIFFCQAKRLCKKVQHKVEIEEKAEAEVGKEKKKKKKINRQQPFRITAFASLSGDVAVSSVTCIPKSSEAQLLVQSGLLSGGAPGK
ncbi:hypothetical protein T4B_11198 [Trichinella pseudospiralis]|nr:hypothetical protein T4D_3090 [Trichinella pseudospiralis]KRZ32629.1 hypothetical protein T4B_11198 [Trichinella pseudospiralis]